MSENIDHAWYLTIDIILFGIAMIAFLFFFVPIQKQSVFSTSRENDTCQPVLLNIQTIYTGQKHYTNKDLYGTAIQDISSKQESVTKSGLYEELLSFPETIPYVSINDKTYVNDLDGEETVNGYKNLAYWNKEGMLDKIQSLGTADIYQKTYRYNKKGAITEVCYRSR